MIINIKKITTNIATAAVVIIFSGYIFYHYAVAKLGFPRVIGGFYSPLIVVFGATISLLQILKPSLLFNKFEFKFYLILLSMALMSAIYLFFGDVVSADKLYASKIFESLLIFYTTYIVFKNANLNSTALRNVLMAAFLIQAIIVIMVSQENGYFTLNNELNEDLKIANYQQIAFIMSLQAGLLMASYRGMKRIFIFLFSSIIFVLVGSRSEFLAFLIAGSLLVLLEIKKTSTKGYVLLLLMVVIYIYLNFDLQGSTLRSFSFFDIKNQTSYLVRNDLLNIALDCISREPLMGCYGEENNIGHGTYSHNLLSAWQTYGLLIFVALAYSLVKNFRDAMFYKSIDNNLVHLAIYYSFIALFLSLFSKYFLDQFIPVAFGILASLKHSEVDSASKYFKNSNTGYIN